MQISLFQVVSSARRRRQARGHALVGGDDGEEDERGGNNHMFFFIFDRELDFSLSILFYPSSCNEIEVFRSKVWSVEVCSRKTLSRRWSLRGLPRCWRRRRWERWAESLRIEKKFLSFSGAQRAAGSSGAPLGLPLHGWSPVFQIPGLP